MLILKELASILKVLNNIAYHKALTNTNAKPDQVNPSQNSSEGQKRYK